MGHYVGLEDVVICDRGLDAAWHASAEAEVSEIVLSMGLCLGLRRKPCTVVAVIGVSGAGHSAWIPGGRGPEAARWGQHRRRHGRPSAARTPG
jgi:hypothetical protein